MDAMTDEPKPPTVVERVMAKMQTLGNQSLHIAARDIRMGYSVFVLVRRLLMIKTWDNVSEQERTEILGLLHLCNTQRYALAEDKSKPLIKKYWLKRSRDGRTPPTPKTDAQMSAMQRFRQRKKINGEDYRSKTRALRKKITRLDNTIFAIREACTNNDELEIPQLNDTMRREYLDVLDTALHALLELHKKLKETINEGP